MTLVAVKSIGTVGKVVSAFVYSAAALAVYTLIAVFGGPLLPVSIASKLPLLLSGGVIDFLDFFVKNYHYPAFNVADSLIFIGICGIFAKSIFHKKEK
jgi:signal peptidase II